LNTLPASVIMNSLKTLSLALAILLEVAALCASASNLLRVDPRLFFNRLMSTYHAPTDVDQSLQPNPQPCCSPNAWQGTVYRSDDFNNIEYSFSVYEDSVNQKSSVDYTVNNKGTVSKGTVILHVDPRKQTGVAYQVDKKAKICYTQKFTNVTFDQLSLTPHCVPKEARYGGVLTIGTPRGGANLPLLLWEWNPRPYLLYQRMVTTDCATAVEVVWGINSTQRTRYVTDSYFDIQPSISDPSVFNPPDYCLKDEEVERSDANMAEEFLQRRMMEGDLGINFDFGEPS